ncbi:phosphatase 2C-like domain-containing protein [Polychytrium aggregatum]|uniref:phosphatase 2C-like domain-containing protein n=1 Tax=Polychytrium aggregatum TaxID=110093 RepID=UPI0022FEFD26|nr:phosphatase 2C-like domain-containing protein [Polychytrium aggregatum]KAI9209664.1 phosphatase 2C-like domain-containing protein [Polychytrium aggregatum]
MALVRSAISGTRLLRAASGLGARSISIAPLAVARSGRLHASSGLLSVAGFATSSGPGSQAAPPSFLSTAARFSAVLLVSAVAFYFIFPTEDPDTAGAVHRHEPSSKLSTNLSKLGAKLLSPAEVTGILEHNQYDVSIAVHDLVAPKSPGSAPPSPPVVQYHINQVASNPAIEDYHCEDQLDNGAVVFGIFDGHGGPHTARILSRELSSYVAHAIKKQSEPSIWSWIWPSPEISRKQLITDALKEAFRAMDSDLVNAAFEPETPDQAGLAYILAALRPAASGSCAILAYIEGNDLYVACTGDSRAVVGRRQTDGSFDTIPLSVDQTVKNAREYGRLLDEHPGELETVVVKGRVLGGLMPTRAFGDSRYKWPVSVQRLVWPHLGKRGCPPHYYTPPYVTAEPEVVHYELDPSKDKFLVLGSDGLYDELSSEECVHLVAGQLERKRLVPPPAYPAEASSQQKNLQFNDLSPERVAGFSYVDDNLATHLIRNAFGGKDDDKIGRLLGIPAPHSRRHRDDITVNVVLFGGPENHASLDDQSAASSSASAPASASSKSEQPPRLRLVGTGSFTQRKQRLKEYVRFLAVAPRPN